MIYRHEDGWMFVDYRTGERRVFRHREEAELYIRHRERIIRNAMVRERYRTPSVVKTPKVDPIAFGRVRKHTMI
jgi:hypothetical protein